MSVNIPALLTLFPERQPVLAARAGAVEFAPIRGPRPYHTLENFSGIKGNIIEDDGYLLAIKAAVDAVRADPRWSHVYNGDLSDYHNDHSRADLALCGEFARRCLNAGSIDTAYRTSGLYRDKWERDDYRNITIAKALSSTNGRADEPASASGKADEQPNALLNPHNGKIAISTEEPLPRNYTVDGLLLPAKSAVLAGFGGVSKTQLAIQISIAIVLGSPFMGRAVKSGGAMLILGEEDRDEIARRVNAIVRHGKLTVEQIHSIKENMLAFGLVGEETRLTIKDKKALIVSGFEKQIIAAARAMGDVRFIVLDHVALFHGGDFNAREDAALTMRVVNHIAQETGASVLLLAHTPKSANDKDKEESDASMVAGSTAFVDQARGAWVLATMRDKEAKGFGISSEDRKLLEFVALNPEATTAKSSATLEGKLIGFVAANPGQYSKTKLRDTQSGDKGPLKASKGKVEKTIEDLLADGRLVNRPPSDQERAMFAHGPRVSNVLDVGP
jgi:hypothetical protein